MRKHRRSRWAAGLMLLCAVPLSGCGTPPWEQSSSARPVPGTTASATAPAPTPVPNDLSSGSTQRTLSAGPVTATVDYWSVLPMAEWTAAATKPLNVSMTTTVAPDDGQKVYLQRVTMTATPHLGDEALPPLEPQSDSATVSPGYLVLSPYSYSQTFNAGAMPAEADRVVVELRYDFLVQTTPTSAEYAKQTASDMLLIALAQG